ncbi:MAG: CDP-glycerol glycerophosphotransferase family protein [Eubacterium sp.]|nr:CDP-glycerol glycerophosphotransferase family protein [Eubacterium sp.]
MKNIALVGLYSLENAGDTILCEVSDYLLRKTGEEVAIRHVDAYPKTADHFNGAGYLSFVAARGMKAVSHKIFYYNNQSAFRYAYEKTFWKLWLKSYYHESFKDVDAIVFAGGGFLKFRTQGLNYLVQMIVSEAKKLGIPVMMNGVGIEGYDEKDLRCQKLKKCINSGPVKVITTRDDIDILKNNYIVNKDIIIDQVGDPAFWTPECYGIEKQESQVVGINLINPRIYTHYGNKKDAEEIKAFYVSLIQEMQKRNMDFLLFSNGMRVDQKLGKYLIRTLGLDSSKLLKRTTSTRKMLNMISNFSCVFGARLHACITSYSLDVPVVGLIWNNKTKMFANMIGKPDCYFEEDDLDVKTIVDKIEEQIHSSYDQDIRNRLKEKTFRYVCDFVKTVKESPYEVKDLSFKDEGFVKSCVVPLRRMKRNHRLKKIPTEQKNVMMIAFQGSYTCNPKAITEELLKRSDDNEINLFWHTRGRYRSSDYPEKLNLVKRGTPEFYRAVASAKVIVDNAHDLARMRIPLKKDQVLMQTWHGSLGIKRLDGNIVMDKIWKKNAKWSKKYTSYLISNSDFETDVFHTSYWGDQIPILRYGHARNDILLNPDSEEALKIKSKVYEELGITDTHKHIAMFAPTHRDGQTESPIPLQYDELKEALEERFGGEWLILLRFHSRLKALSREWVENLPDYVVDATPYPDMQDILLITDVGITDYSSWIFDYILLKKPGFIITGDDMEQYVKDRDFYYPLDTTPFPIAVDCKELVRNIKAFDEELFQKRTEDFLKARGCMDDGHASERIADKILEIINS